MELIQLESIHFELIESNMADSHASRSSVENYLESTLESSNSNLEREDSLGAFGDQLAITEKGVLKWTGNFEGLRSLVGNLDVPCSEWRAAGGSCKVYEADGITIRWYSNSGTITIKECNEKEIEAQIRSFIRNEQVNKEVKSVSLSGDEEEAEAEVDLHTDNIPLGNKTIDLTNDVGYQFNEIRNNMRKLEERINRKVDSLSSAICNPKRTEQCDCPNELVQLLKQENQHLKDENQILQERNNNLSYIMSDLNTKVKDIENEKQSLVTALKILHTDLESYSGNNPLQCEENIAQRNPWLIAHGKTKKHSGSPELFNNNKYSALIIEDNEDVEDDKAAERQIQAGSSKGKEKEKVKPPSRNPRLRRDNRVSSLRHPSLATHNEVGDEVEDDPAEESRRESHHNQHKQAVHRANVAIIGDSMLKYINPSKLRKNSNHSVRVRTFPGARIDDMKHYVKPTLASGPDYLVLHVGTNDMKQSSPQQISGNISSLGQEIMKTLPETNLIISGVITRTDDSNLTTKVNEVNAKLSQVCSNNKWGFISHKNILANHLNLYGVHLNKQGTAIMAKNITNYLKNYN